MRLVQSVLASRTDPMVDGRQSERALAIQRGVRRYLRALGFASVCEMTLKSGRRADVVAVSQSGDIHIVEIKSSVADFNADRKWPDYRAFCDRFYFATLQDVPADIFPDDAGLFVADAYGADMIRDAPEHRLSAARRKAVTLLFARSAANALHALADPDTTLPGM